MAEAAVQKDLRAFELRATHQDLTGATVSHGEDGRTFDIKAALDSADEHGPSGVVVVDAQQQPDLAERLATFAALKPASLPDDLKSEQDRHNKRVERDAAADSGVPVGAESVAAHQEFLKSQDAAGEAAPDEPAPAAEAESQTTTSRRRSGAQAS